MKAIETLSLAATCGHSQTGSSKVIVNGKGASRVGVDTALGIINGPGSSRVFVEGAKASLTGDVVLPHPCCGSPGCGPHCVAKTNPAGQPIVMVGE